MRCAAQFYQFSLSRNMPGIFFASIGIQPSSALITWSVSIGAVRSADKAIPARRKRREDVRNIRIVKFEPRFSISRLKGNRKESPGSEVPLCFWRWWVLRYFSTQSGWKHPFLHVLFCDIFRTSRSIQHFVSRGNLLGCECAFRAQIRKQ